jgi:hypothetical protein
MAEEHPAHFPGVQAGALESDEGRGAAVDEEASLAGAGEMQAGLEAAAGAEGIAGA